MNKSVASFSTSNASTSSSKVALKFKKPAQEEDIIPIEDEPLINYYNRWAMEQQTAAKQLSEGAGNSESTSKAKNKDEEEGSTGKTVKQIQESIYEELKTVSTTGSSLLPREVVGELDRFIVGQQEAKKAVAIALRNRW